MVKQRVLAKWEVRKGSEAMKEGKEEEALREVRLSNFFKIFLIAVLLISLNLNNLKISKLTCRNCPSNTPLFLFLNDFTIPRLSISDPNHLIFASTSSTVRCLWLSHSRVEKNIPDSV